LHTTGAEDTTAVRPGSFYSYSKYMGHSYPPVDEATEIARFSD
jgi:hypothetical protein